MKKFIINNWKILLCCLFVFVLIIDVGIYVGKTIYKVKNTNISETIKEYIVSFDYGDGNSPIIVNVKKGNKVEKPEDPIADGYLFKGWYLENNEFDFDTKISKNISLVAKWTTEDGKDVAEKIDISNKNEEINNESYLNASSDSDLIKVNINVNCPSHTDTKQRFELLLKKGTKVVPIADFEKNSPMCLHYDFLGWYVDGKKIDDDYKITKSVSVEGKWQEHFYSINFDSRGGSKVDSIPCAVYTTTYVAKPKNPTKEGYDFLGWRYSLESGDYFYYIYFNQVNMCNMDVTLYAEWSKKDSTDIYKFDYNEGLKNNKYGLLIHPALDAVYFFVPYTLKDALFEVYTSDNENGVYERIMYLNNISLIEYSESVPQYGIADVYYSSDIENKGKMLSNYIKIRLKDNKSNLDFVTKPVRTADYLMEIVEE